MLNQSNLVLAIITYVLILSTLKVQSASTGSTASNTGNVYCTTINGVFTCSGGSVNYTVSSSSTSSSSTTPSTSSSSTT